MCDAVLYQPALNPFAKLLEVGPVKVRPHIAIVASGDCALRGDDRFDIFGKAHVFCTDRIREIMVNTRIEADQSKTKDGKNARNGFSHPKRYGKFMK